MRPQQEHGKDVDTRVDVLAASSPAGSTASDNEVEFNINEFVRVKINDVGWRILAASDDTLNEHLKAMTATWRSTRAQRLREEQDRDGYTRWQLWSLMEAFGPSISLGSVPPFETSITLLVSGGPRTLAAVDPADGRRTEGPRAQNSSSFFGPFRQAPCLAHVPLNNEQALTPMPTDSCVRCGWPRDAHVAEPEEELT